MALFITLKKKGSQKPVTSPDQGKGRVGGDPVLTEELSYIS